MALVGPPMRLNIAEIEFSVFKRVGLKNRVASVDELVQLVKEYETERNKQEKKVNWQFKTKDARIKLKKLYPNI